eukprot:Colp12_sorted_trinity150504_noHs@31605
MDLVCIMGERRFKIVSILEGASSRVERSLGELELRKIGSILFSYARLSVNIESLSLAVIGTATQRLPVKNAIELSGLAAITYSLAIFGFTKELRPLLRHIGEHYQLATDPKQLLPAFYAYVWLRCHYKHKRVPDRRVERVESLLPAECREVFVGNDSVRAHLASAGDD